MYSKMPVSKETLRGYILEEVLAYLIRNTGYKLLTKPSDDPEDLTINRGGLVVKGRGAMHQVDVLGQLEWVPAFTYPIRLFVEAKFRDTPTGLRVVRNAVGVVLDINQKHKTIEGTDRPAQQYHYAYSLFSTSGFTRTAQDMALAHQISLVDLSGSEYESLRNSIDAASERISSNGRRRRLVKNLRMVLREGLETASFDHDTNVRISDIQLINELRTELQDVIRETRTYNELFVGMVNGPFILLLKAQNPVRFLNYMRENPKTKVSITWNVNREGGSIWQIRPSRREDHSISEQFVLDFRLPDRLKTWMFGEITEIAERAATIKQEFMPSITIFHRDELADRLFKLEFDRVETDRWVTELNRIE